jgi:hypothetical protein
MLCWPSKTKLHAAALAEHCPFPEKTDHNALYTSSLAVSLRYLSSCYNTFLHSSHSLLCSARPQAIPSSPSHPPTLCPALLRPAMLSSQVTHPNHFPPRAISLLSCWTDIISLPLFPIALSSPISLLSRQDSCADSCADTCGHTCYSSSDVSDALSAGYNLYTSGSTEGSGGYPHQ